MVVLIPSSIPEHLDEASKLKNTVFEFINEFVIRFIRKELIGILHSGILLDLQGITSREETIQFQMLL